MLLIAPLFLAIRRSGSPAERRLRYGDCRGFHFSAPSIRMRSTQCPSGRCNHWPHLMLLPAASSISTKRPGSGPGGPSKTISIWVIGSSPRQIPRKSCRLNAIRFLPHRLAKGELPEGFGGRYRRPFFLAPSLLAEYLAEPTFPILARQIPLYDPAALIRRHRGENTDHSPGR